MASKDFDGIHVADAIGKLKFEGNPLDLKEDPPANDGKYLINRICLLYFQAFDVFHSWLN